MALAPKARSFTLYEAGRDGSVFGDITIPPLPDIFTVYNTLAGSTKLSAVVAGEPAIYAALYPRLSAVKARREAVRNRRLALIPRITVLEGGTATTPVIPPATTDPAYGPADQVVQNATRFSDFLDTSTSLTTTEQAALDATAARIVALNSIPANALTYQGQVLTYQGQPLTYGAAA